MAEKTVTDIFNEAADRVYESMFETKIDHTDPVQWGTYLAGVHFGLAKCLARVHEQMEETGWDNEEERDAISTACFVLAKIGSLGIKQMGAKEEDRDAVAALIEKMEQEWKKKRDA